MIFRVLALNILFLTVTFASTEPLSLTTTTYAITAKPQNALQRDHAFTFTSKITGDIAELPATKWHRPCPDSYTKCDWMGYKFQNGPFTFYLYHDGRMQVYKEGSELVLEEKGKWE